MIWGEPTVWSRVVTRLAWPAAFRGAVASSVVPSKNDTLPVGVPTAGTGLTVAVNVMKLADLIVDADDVRLVVVPAVLALLTSWVTVGEVLGAKLAVPL